MLKIIGFSIVSCFALILYIPTAHALASVDFAIEEICAHMQGNLGGLLMAAAGVGGIASAAFGNMKAMYSCLVTAIGAFGISAVLSLHFPDAANKCSGGAGGGAGAGGAARVAAKSISSAEVSKFDPEQAAKSFISLYNKSEESEESEDVVKESDVTNEQLEDENSDLDLF